MRCPLLPPAFVVAREVAVVSERDSGRHPLGRRCGDKRILLLALLMTLFYALPRYAFDCLRGRG